MYFIPGPKGTTLKIKINYIISKNKGLKVLLKCNKVLLVEEVKLNEIYQVPSNYNMLNNYLSRWTSKNIYIKGWRQSFTDKKKKLEYHLIINFNNKE